MGLGQGGSGLKIAAEPKAARQSREPTRAQQRAFGFASDPHAVLTRTEQRRETAAARGSARVVHSPPRGRTEASSNGGSGGAPAPATEASESSGQKLFKPSRVRRRWTVKKQVPALDLDAVTSDAGSATSTQSARPARAAADEAAADVREGPASARPARVAAWRAPRTRNAFEK